VLDGRGGQGFIDLFALPVLGDHIDVEHQVVRDGDVRSADPLNKSVRGGNELVSRISSDAHHVLVMLGLRLPDSQLEHIAGSGESGDLVRGPHSDFHVVEIPSTLVEVADPDIPHRGGVIGMREVTRRHVVDIQLIDREFVEGEPDEHLLCMAFEGRRIEVGRVFGLLAFGLLTFGPGPRGLVLRSAGAPGGTQGHDG
jgi:hypothetical protein